MADQTLAYWDEVFAGLQVVADPVEGHWIERLLPDPAARAAVGGQVLELGCGLGWDTRWLLRAGCAVAALDGSAVALDKLRAAVPGPDYVHHCLPAPLPFPSASFDAVVAGLSLHYFPWNDSVGIIQEVRRVLRPGGLFLFAVNATGDVNHGYGQGVEVEPGLFDVQGRLKRFFSEADCRHLLAGNWRRLALASWEELRFGHPKAIWAAAALKRP